jgi:uncharacterized protein involved in copper resistance
VHNVGLIEVSKHKHSSVCLHIQTSRGDIVFGAGSARQSLGGRDDRRESAGANTLVRRQMLDGLRARHAAHDVAPYIGWAYNSTFGRSARYTRVSGEATKSSSFVFWLFVWH